jgi:hypothetical protein
LGNVRATKNAIDPLRHISNRGYGSYNSATIGENTVIALATKLQIPVAVALLS